MRIRAPIPPYSEVFFLFLYFIFKTKMEQYTPTVSLTKHVSPSSRTRNLYIWKGINTFDIIVMAGHVAGNCQQLGPA